MTSLRRVLSPLVGLWLCCQLGAVALTPLAFWARMSAEAATCICPLGADAACPMHHKPGADTKAETKTGTKICAMQSTTSEATTLLTSLFAGTGLMPESVSLIDRATSGTFAILEPQMTARHPVPPDPPPPRA
jgi:hypothetical protein